MVRLNMSDTVRKTMRTNGGTPYGKREVIWERGNLIKWIKACRSDRGSPRFVKFGNELESSHKITAICWGGYNRTPGAGTTIFKNVGDEDKMILMDNNKKDWVQLINKYGAEKTKVELLHHTKGFMELRMKCEDCYPACIGVDC